MPLILPLLSQHIHMSKRDNRSAMSLLSDIKLLLHLLREKSHLIYVLTMLMRFTEAKATIPKLQMLFLLRVQLKRNTSSKLPFGLKKILFCSWSVCRGIPESERIHGENITRGGFL